MSALSLMFLWACGTSWSPTSPEAQPVEPVLELSPNPKKRMPWLAGAKSPSLWSDGGDLHLVWIEDEGDIRRLRYAHLRDAWWSEATTITEDPRLLVNWADTPKIAQGGDGALVVSWPRSHGDAAPYAYDVQVSRSTDNGRSWTDLGSPHRDGTATEHGFVSMVPRASGVDMIWLDGREGIVDGPMALRSATIGDSMGASVVLDDRVCDCCSTAMALTSEGPVAVYRDRDDKEVRDIGVVRREGESWAVPSGVWRDDWVVSGCPVNGPRAWARGRDVGVIWYTEHPEPAVRFATSRDGGRSFGRPMRFADKTTLGRVDVIDAGSSSVILTWMDRVEDRAMIRASRFFLTGKASKPYDIASADVGRGSGFPRAALTESGLFVVWTDVETNTLGHEIVPMEEIDEGF